MILYRLDSCILFKNEKAHQIFKYIGSGILITAGFVDLGNWAANMVAGTDYEYDLLWMVTLSAIMLIVLQHNVAHYQYLMALLHVFIFGFLNC